MNKRFLLILEIALALAALVAGYIFIVGRSAIDTPAVARPATAPDNPHILYLAPEGTNRGAVNDGKMQEKGVTLVRDWTSARAAADSQPLDALLADAAMFDIISAEDTTWLQAQFRNGVVIVSLGLEDDKLAQTLGLKTLRSPEEADIPLGSTGYRLVSSYIFGEPEDIKKLEDSDWINRYINDDDQTPPNDIKNPLTFSVSKERGELNSNDDLDLLVLRVKSHIEGFYQAKKEMQ